MTRCACERDGNTIPSPVAQQQRGDKGGKLFIKVLLECCIRQGKHRWGRTHKPPGTKAATGQHQAREMMERHDELPGPSLPNDQEQEKGDLGVSAEERSKKAPRYGENSNHCQSLGPREAKSSDSVVTLSWQITGEEQLQSPVGRAWEGPTLPKGVCRQEPRIVCENNRD